jgi:hypothetical protein
VETQRVVEVWRTEKTLSLVDSLSRGAAGQLRQRPVRARPDAGQSRELTTFLRYAHEQGYTAQTLSVNELFVPETLTP